MPKRGAIGGRIVDGQAKGLPVTLAVFALAELNQDDLFPKLRGVNGRTQRRIKRKSDAFIINFRPG
jgi:hypothetical protein